MSEVKKYDAKKLLVIAIQLPEKCQGLKYEKWGGLQAAKPLDWLVIKQGETYTIDAESFANTMEPLDQPGHYYKKSSVWAKIARDSGKIKTKEGLTNYKKGWYIVSNDGNFEDAYAMSEEKFKSLYETGE